MVRDPSSLPGPAAQALRPLRSVFRRSLRTLAFSGLLLTAVAVVRLREAPWLLPSVLGGLALACLGIVLYFHNTRIELQGGRYRVTNLLGSVREFAAREVERVVVIDRLGIHTSTPAEQLLVQSTTGRPLLKLGGGTWAGDALRAVADDLRVHGRPLERIDEPLSHAQLRERHPELVTWWDAHPFAVGILAALAIILLVVAGVLAAVAGR